MMFLFFCGLIWVYFVGGCGVFGGIVVFRVVFGVLGGGLGRVLE